MSETWKVIPEEPEYLISSTKVVVGPRGILTLDAHKAVYINSKRRSVNKLFCKLFGKESLPGEVWKRISDYPNYEVSNLGRFYHLGPKNSGYVQVKSFARSNRLQVVLSGKHGVNRRSVARVVAEVFVPNPSRLSYVEFNNGNSQDCRAANLVWVRKGRSTDEEVTRLRTEAANKQLTLAKIVQRCGLHISSQRASSIVRGSSYKGVSGQISHRLPGGRKGSDNGRALITPGAVREVFVLREQGWSFTRIGQQLGVSAYIATRVYNRSNWRHMGVTPTQRNLIISQMAKKAPQQLADELHIHVDNVTGFIQLWHRCLDEAMKEYKQSEEQAGS